MPLIAGTRLGPYEITAPLGAGGMGEVYRARDSRLNRDVAIKTLPAGFANNLDRLARFEREAQVLAALNHPNIAMIFGIEEGALVMELVEGPTLAERLAASGPIPLDEALAIARQIVDAVEAAHEKGIIHRDLKPANIKITPEGKVKVLDFGLGKMFDTGPATGLSESPTLAMDATRVGAVLGTAGYMAPEQARGQAVDRRADVWAFGVLLYEMLTGKRPFLGASNPDLLVAVLAKEPDWGLLPPATPARVGELLRLCLAKDKRTRLQAIGDARIFLHAPAEEASLTKTPHRRQNLPWAIAAALAFLGAISLWAPWRTPPAASERPYLQLDLNTGSDQVSQPAISRDGMRVVFVSKGALALRRLDEGKNTPLPGTEDAFAPFFSPDGRWVAFFAHRKLQKIAVDGGAPITLCEALGEGGGTWGDDDHIVAALTKGGGLSQIPAAGGTPQPLTDPTADASAPAHLWPQALPDGKGLLYGASNGSWQGSIRVRTPHDGEKILVQDSTHGRYLAGGYLVFHRRGTLFAAPMDLGRLQLTGPAVPLVDEVSYSDTRADFDVSVSGTLIYYRSTLAANLVPSWLYPSGKSEPLMKPGNYMYPRLSPDGKRLALSVIADGNQNLWVYEISREILTRLTFAADPDLFPAWTSDGDFLAFRSGNTLAWTRSDGSGKLERLAVVNSTVAPRSFSPDGKWLTFWPVGARSDLWVVPVERTPGTLKLGSPARLWQRAGTEGAPTISPDGKWVAYTSDESGNFEIYVKPFEPHGTTRSAKWQASNDGGATPVWSSDGRSLFYQNGHRVMVTDYKAQGESFVVEKPRIWSERRLGDAGFFPGYDVAPDSTRILALLASEDVKPDTFLHVLLNVGSELRRRTSARVK
jgi:serine/threonine protein kinase/Tol biopolymer transport system component